MKEKPALRLKQRNIAKREMKHKTQTQKTRPEKAKEKRREEESERKARRKRRKKAKTFLQAKRREARHPPVIDGDRDGESGRASVLLLRPKEDDWRDRMPSGRVTAASHSGVTLALARVTHR